MFKIKIGEKTQWLGDVPQPKRDIIIDTKLNKMQLLTALKKEGERLKDNATSEQLMELFKKLKEGDESLVKYFLELLVSSRSTIGKVSLLSKLEEDKLKEVLKLIYK